MSELDELKDVNEAEHKTLSNSIKSIGLVNKVLMIILIGIFGVMLTVLLSINNYSRDAYNIRVKTFNSIEILKESANKNSVWIHTIYTNEIHRNTLRSEDNAKKIIKLSKKDGTE